MKAVQERGFKWMLEAQEKEKISKNKSKEYLANVMLNEKEDKVKKELFKEIFDLFKKQLNKKPFKSSTNVMGDEIMIETDSQNKNFDFLIQNLELMQRLIIKDKRYLKESIRGQLF